MVLNFICNRKFVAEAKNIDINIKSEYLVEKVDITKNLTLDIIEKCYSKQYVERENALKYFDKIITEAGTNIKNVGLNDIFNALKDRINDNNLGVKKMAVEIIGKLANGMGDKAVR